MKKVKLYIKKNNFDGLSRNIDEKIKRLPH